MSQLSLLAESLVGSEIVKLGNEINNRIARGEKIYNYTIGDFDPHIFPIPKQLEDNIVNCYRQGFTNYPPGDGAKDLREAVTAFIGERMGIHYELNEVQIASGGRPLIYSLFRTLVDEGDKVIYAVPSWNNNHYTHMNWGQHCCVAATSENNFMPTAADIAPHISGAALICLCSPQNPTGTTLGKDELAKICKLVLDENKRRSEKEKKLYVMYDQMYWMLTFGNVQHYNPVSLVPEMKDYTIFVDGISKTFAATGVRVGWGLGPAKVIGKMKAFLSHIGAWSPMAEQKATALFLKDSAAVDSYLGTFKKKIETRLHYIYNGFQALKEKGFPVDAITPQAAIYLTIKIDLKGRVAAGKPLATQAAVTDYILSEAKLAVVPFSCFGAGSESPWYRISVGTCSMDDLAIVFTQLEHALEKTMTGTNALAVSNPE